MNVASKEHCQELYELWHEIDGIPYEVSNRGNVRHIKNKTNRKLYQNKDGYMQTGYTMNAKTHNLHVHQLVAKYFVPFVDGKYHVNHIDSNPSHNCATNLEWCTPGENVEHSRKFGRANLFQTRGEGHGMHKLTVNQVINIKHCKGAISGYKLAALYEIGDQTIYDIWNGRRWKHVR